MQAESVVCGLRIAVRGLTANKFFYLEVEMLRSTACSMIGYHSNSWASCLYRPPIHPKIWSSSLFDVQ